MMTDTLPLFEDAELAALRVPGTVPDPEAAARYLSAWDNAGIHHAISAQEHPGARPGSMNTAVCGSWGKLARPRGTYFRAPALFPGALCRQCAWYTAITTSAIEREIRFQVPAPDDAGRLAGYGVDALAVVKITRAILADPRWDTRPGTRNPDMEAVTLLACLSAHAPALTYSTSCLEGDCGCEQENPAVQCPRTTAAVCVACTPVTGPWAGEMEGRTITGCRVEAPCSIITTLSRHYGVTQATSPYDTPAAVYRP